MSFKKKYVDFWMGIDGALGRMGAAINRWEERHRNAPRWQWHVAADRPYQFKPGHSGKRLGQAFDALYENRFSRWLAGKQD